MSHRNGSRTLAAFFMSVALVAFPVAGRALLPSVALAEETSAAAEQAFSYQHDPIYNPRAMQDVVANPDAVYGFSPNPDAGSISGYAVYDWTDPDFVAQAYENRKSYIEQDRQMLGIVVDLQAQGATVEEIARAVSARRNQIRLDSYRDDPEGLAIVKARNLEKYGNEEGPTPEWLYNRYGSWEAVIDSAFSTNPGMDACCGLYDENWESYVFFGQIPLHTVSFDAAGHGVAPAAQSVYAGEQASEPEVPAEEEGWAFRGWFAEGAAEPFDFSAPIAADVVLTASWEELPAQDEGKADDDETPDDAGTGDDTSQETVPTVGGATSDDAAPAQPTTPAQPAAPAQPATPPAQVASSRAATLPATGDPAAELPVAACLACGTVALALGVAGKVRDA